MKTISVYLALVAGTISLCLAFATQAGSDLSQNQIRELVRQGKILPLQNILDRYEGRGRLLDLEVEREHGMIIYELELLQGDGRVLEIEIDAANGDVLEEEFER